MLQDTESGRYRYTDAELIEDFNNAIAECKRLRPDLFVYKEALPYYSTSELSEDFPVTSIYFQAVVYFVVGNAELRDDEFAVDGRAMSLLTSFTAKLRGAA